MEVAHKSILSKYIHTTAHRKSTTWQFLTNHQPIMSNLKENVSKMHNKIHTFQVIIKNFWKFLKIWAHLSPFIFEIVPDNGGFMNYPIEPRMLGGIIEYRSGTNWLILSQGVDFMFIMTRVTQYQDKSVKNSNMTSPSSLGCPLITAMAI